MSDARAQGRRRRAAAHACPVCTRPWALRATPHTPGVWLLSCRFCGWGQPRTPAVDPAGGGAESPTGTPASRHALCLYADDQELLTPVVDYATAGWQQDGVCVVVATPEHRAALRARLAARGLESGTQDGRLVELDAADTLALFMRDGVPDPVLFDESVGALLRQHAAERPVHVFGEMVHLLWADGNVAGALQLEQLWTQLQERVAFSLLCGYAADRVGTHGRGVLQALHDPAAG